MQSYLNIILDPNEKSLSRLGSLLGFFVTLYGLKLVEKQMRIFKDYLTSANLVIDLFILVLVISILVYVMIKLNFRFKFLKILTLMLIVMISLYTSHVTINQFSTTIFKLRLVSSSQASIQTMIDNKENERQINLSKIQSCKNGKFELLIRKNDSCSKKNAKTSSLINRKNNFLDSNTFLAFMLRVSLLVFAYLIAIRMLIWLVIDLPEKENNQDSILNEKHGNTRKIEEKQSETFFQEVSEIVSNDSHNIIKSENRLSYVKNISAKTSQDHLNIRKKIRRKHFDTAKTHSYSMDNLNTNINTNTNSPNNSGTSSLVSLKIGNLKCYESSSTTFASKKSESNFTLESTGEPFYENSKMDNINLINWIFFNGIDAKFGKMLFSNFLNNTVQDLVSSYNIYFNFKCFFDRCG
jgi:hypothetical protein